MTCCSHTTEGPVCGQPLLQQTWLLSSELELPRGAIDPKDALLPAGVTEIRQGRWVLGVAKPQRDLPPNWQAWRCHLMASKPETQGIFWDR